MTGVARAAPSAIGDDDAASRYGGMPSPAGQRSDGIARNSACVNRTSDAPSTGPIATSTTITTTSLGTKASV